MDPLLLSMAGFRFISSLVEFFAALLFLRSGSLETALRVNALLGLIGPCFFVGVSMLGVFGIAARVSLVKIAIIFMGIVLVFIGTCIK